MKNNKILVVSNIFPNQYEPRKGMFNLQQFKSLSSLVSLQVLAPIPYFPGMNRFPLKASSGRVKKNTYSCTADGLKVYYPFYFSPPKIARNLYGFFFYLGIRKIAKQIWKNFPFQAIYVAWAYPDAVGCALLAKELGVPYFVQVLGSDINDYSQYYFRRKMIVHTLNNAIQVISVSQALKYKLVEIGVRENQVAVVYDGVDKNIFHPVDKNTARKKLCLDENEKHILFVGNLKPVKGLNFLIPAFKHLVDNYQEKVKLHVIGFGVLQPVLEEMTAKFNLSNQVNFLGEKDHAEIALWMNASNLLVLPSLSEGVPNVILESLACGTPVITTDVGGIPEVIVSGELGLMVPPKDASALARALRSGLGKKWSTSTIVQSSQKFSWKKNVQQLYSFIAPVITKS